MNKKTTDEKLLQLFQKLSDWFQIWLGVDCFAIAKFLIGFSCFALLCERTYSFYMKGFNWLEIITGALYLLIAQYLLGIIKHGERSVRNNPVFTNPNVLRLQFIRSFMAFFLPITLFLLFANLLPQYNKSMNALLRNIFWNLYEIAYISAVYFGSCTPKPPSRSKVSKIKESLSHSGQRVPGLSVAKN